MVRFCTDRPELHYLVSAEQAQPQLVPGFPTRAGLEQATYSLSLRETDFLFFTLNLNLGTDSFSYKFEGGSARDV